MTAHRASLREGGTLSTDTGYEIVVVDDDEMVRAVLRARLDADERFVAVGEAADGRSGGDVVLAEAPDAVLLDMEMPILNGHKTITFLRDSQYDGVIVLFSSDVDAFEMALRLGADAAFAKSFDVQLVLERVIELCESRRSGRRLRTDQ